MGKTAVVIPCFKRPEYTKLCLEYLEKSQVYKDVDFYIFDDGSNDGTFEIIQSSKLPITVFQNKDSIGLRNVLINFFNIVKDKDYDFLAKMDNDCLVPANWLDDLEYILSTHDFDILSPNVLPSNAAFLYGKEGHPVRPAVTVGGLWFMKAQMINGMDFEAFAPNGINGAFNLLKQIIAEKEARCGWVPDVTVQDIGHWSGEHPLHIKSKEHEEYSAYVGRPISWTA